MNTYTQDGVSLWRVLGVGQEFRNTLEQIAVEIVGQNTLEQIGGSCIELFVLMCFLQLPPLYL